MLRGETHARAHATSLKAEIDIHLSYLTKFLPVLPISIAFHKLGTRFENTMHSFYEKCLERSSNS